MNLEEKHFKAVDWSRVCRTSKIGRAQLVCTGCGEVSYITRSCKHRFCALCGIAETNKWGKKMLSKLMNCKHHHILMTLPKAFRSLSKQNGDKFHDMLFKASSAVINEWFEKRCHLKVGSASVLHTAGADLKYHPHVHMIVSRGGYDLRQSKYRFIAGDYLCKNEILGKLLKQKFEELLIKSYEKGEITLYRSLTNKVELLSWLRKLKEKHWIVNIEKPLEDIKQIIGYVGRYTKRACLSEYKLVYVGEDSIKFSYNDYKHSERGQTPKQSIISLPPYNFLDRLLQHVPTKGYRMVRYSGLYNSYYLNRIPEAYKLIIPEQEGEEWEDDYDWGDYEAYRKDMIKAGHADPFICPHCQIEKIVVAIEIEKEGILITKPIYDSS